jgi:hypothetical protein
MASAEYAGDEILQLEERVFVALSEDSVTSHLFQGHLPCMSGWT